VGPHPGGPDWMPITPKTGALFHADSQSRRGGGCAASAHLEYPAEMGMAHESLDALLPVLYLHGISAADFQEVLAALLGKDAPNLSPAVIARLKGEWEEEYQRWQRRDLSARRYV
jgi:putative transposase